MIQILEYLKIITDEQLVKVCQELNTTYTASPFPDPRVEGIILDTRKVHLIHYPNLKVISRVGVGLDNIDLEECKKRGIKVYNTPCDELTDSVAEFTVMQILNFLRNKRKSVYGKTVGIIGYGRIGRALNEILKSFRCDIRAYDIAFSNRPDYCFTTGKYFIYKELDIICVHISGNEEVIGEKEIEGMKQKPIIVNMARSGCVNLEAVLNAIKEEKISGFITDVDEIDSNIGRYIINGKVLQTPHVASDTIQARTAMENLALQNLIKGLKE